MRNYWDNRVRIYKAITERWTDENGRTKQVELFYEEYNLDTLEIVATGFEDFSAERYNKLIFKLVWKWDGEKRNAGGQRRFDYMNIGARYNRGDGGKVREYFKKVMQAADIQLR